MNFQYYNANGNGNGSMNMNMNNSSNSIPKPSFSGTIGVDEREQENKRQKVDLGYKAAYNPTFQQQTFQQNSSNAYFSSFYNPNFPQPYMNNSMAQYPSQLMPYQYQGQSQFNNSTFSSAPYLQNNRQWNYENNVSNDLIDYKDMYSEGKGKTSQEQKTSNKVLTTEKSLNVAKPKVNELRINDFKKSATSIDNSKKRKHTQIEPDTIIINQDADEQEAVNKKTASGLENEENISDVEEDIAKESVTVPGTSITLVTDEDIKKWREERKKMWLLKISNNKEKHMQDMGIKKEDINKLDSVLKESKKERQFIQGIQNQVNRFNPNVNLNIKFVQREMAQENIKLLDFIKELGDAGLLEYQLTEEEKMSLFGKYDSMNKKTNNNSNNNRGFNENKLKRPYIKGKRDSRNKRYNVNNTKSDNKNSGNNNKNS